MPLAVITGSSSGIGRATAIEFARRGYHLVLHANRNLAGLQSTADEIRQRNSQAIILCATCDLSNAAACRQFVNMIFCRSTIVDAMPLAWVNNAGADVLTGALAKQSFESKLSRLWEVDVLGTIRVSRLVGQRMLQEIRSTNQDTSPRDHALPSIVNIGWDQAETGMEGDAGEMFCPIKAAIQAFTRSLAKSLAPSVRVNCVAPGWIQTKWGENAPAVWDTRARSECLLGRWGTPEDVARTVAWLACEGTFLNGQIVNVNGGFRAHTQ